MKLEKLNPRRIRSLTQKILAALLSSEGGKFFHAHRKRLKTVFITLFSFLMLSVLIATWQYYQTHITTDNAYINANAIQVAAQVSGSVQNLYVENNQAVKENDPIFDIDPKPFLVAIDQANAKVSQRQAELKNAKIALDRVEKVVAQKFLPPEEKDNAETAMQVAAANLQVAEAELAQAKLNLGYTHVTAQVSGVINNLSLRPGTIVQAKNPLFVLINEQQFWVDANFKETELTNIRPEQTAKIVLDMYPNHILRGVVESISGSSGAAFSLLPPQNATGNWVKVTQRIPVKVMIINPDSKFPLRIGATATVTINTASTPIVHDLR